MLPLPFFVLVGEVGSDTAAESYNGEGISNPFKVQLATSGSYAYWKVLQKRTDVFSKFSVFSMCIYILSLSSNLNLLKMLDSFGCFF